MIFRFLENFGGPFWYPFLLLLWTICAMAAGILLLSVKKDDPQKFGKISRLRLPGTVLGAVDLCWSIPHAAVILPDSMKGWLVPAAVVILVLGWWTLDHLFSRALGAFMILSAHFFLRESFASPVPGSAVFAFLCMAFAVLGICLSGEPYKLRKAIFPGAGKYRYCLPVFLMIFSAACLLTLILHLAGSGAAE